MNWKGLLGDAFPIIEKAAPVLAAAIGSPAAGSAALFAVNILGSAFGVGPADVHSLGEKILSTDNNCDLLKELQQHFGQYFPPVYLVRPSSAELNLKLNWDNNQLPVDKGKILD